MRGVILCLPILACACDGTTVPPDPAAFLGAWTCDPAATPDSGSPYLGISMGTDGHLVVAPPGSTACAMVFAVSGRTATPVFCGSTPTPSSWSPSADPGCAPVLLCGTSLTANGSSIMGTLVIGVPDGGVTSESVSCVPPGTIDAGPPPDASASAFFAPCASVPQGDVFHVDVEPSGSAPSAGFPVGPVTYADAGTTWNAAPSNPAAGVSLQIQDPYGAEADVTLSPPFFGSSLVSPGNVASGDGPTFDLTLRNDANVQGSASMSGAVTVLQLGWDGGALTAFSAAWNLAYDQQTVTGCVRYAQP
jgi:hypothetical protein